MLLQFKVYIIASLYFLGVVFMILFPPRNFEQSGAKIRTIRSLEKNLIYPQYIDHKTLLVAVENICKNETVVASLVTLTPNTAKNRSLIALELRNDMQSKKPGILIIGSLNGMAWGASNAILELAEKLLYNSNYQTPFFNDYDWYLIPMGNPDGNDFTKHIRNYTPLNSSEWSRNYTARSSTRPAEWYKNVDRETEQDVCFGTNVNRNFAYHWQDDVQKSPDRCSQFYPGVKPFSTAEAQAIRTYIDKLGDVIHLAIHLHASFVPRKELILYPWRYSLRQPSNYRTLQAIGEYAARQARLPDGRLYEVHQSSTDGRVAGSVSDYILGVAGTELVFLVKPYHEKYPNIKDVNSLETYVMKATSAILSLVRGWRKSTKQNTLSFFGRDVEF